MALIVALVFVPLVSSFSSSTSLEMSYKPPVQSSVNKIRSSRLSSITAAEESQRRRSSKQQASAAAFVATPSSSSNTSNVSSSFEGRMRGLVFGRENNNNNNKKTAIQLPANVCTVETLEEYRAVVGEEDTKLVCVRFYAPWCKACKAVAPLFYHMANKFPNVVFVDVPVTDKNTNLHQGLGVPSLPFGHMYHPRSGLVEELRMTRKCIPSFATKLQSYVTGSCELKGIGETTSPYPPEQES